MDDKAEDLALLDVAEAITDGRPVDWEAARLSHPELAGNLAHLRLIETVASVHSTPVSGGAAEAPKGGSPEKDLPRAGPDRSLSHYRLIEKVGEGGMGVVWRADDTILRRTVALKVLPADVARDERRRQMFLDEARLASSLNEAHIAQIYEFGREGDLDFIVMEFVEGKPLSKVLQGRPLAPGRVASLGLQAARALSKAHRKGLLHRDLKPSNIMLTPDDEVKIVDFGLATLFAPADDLLASQPATESLTGRRSAPQDFLFERRPAGTLPYMAPEQVQGERLDARSDVFSLGVVLYEATVGQRPFRGATAQELAREISQARFQPVHELVPRVPLELDRIIKKSLASRPSERYQTMEDLAVDLRRLEKDLESGSSPSYDDLMKRPAKSRPRRVAALAAVAIAAIAALGFILWQRGFWNFLFHPAAGHAVLILPFEVRGGEEGGEYLGRAFAEAIAVNLAQAKELQVLPIPSMTELKSASAFAPARAAVNLGAGRLLSGSLQRKGTSIQVSVSLVDTAENRILWGTQTETEDASLTTLAISFSQQIADRLGAARVHRYDYPRNLTGTPEMAASPEFTEALGAIRRYEHQPSLDATRRLVERFPRELEARMLRAYSLFQDGGERSDLDSELETLDRMDPGNPTAKNIRCEILILREGKKDEGLRCVTDLLERNDLTPAARAWALRDRSAVRSARNEPDAALHDIREAAALDPTNHYNFQVLGQVQSKMGNIREAEVSFRQSLFLVPENINASMGLVRALWEQGKFREAVPFAARFSKGNPFRGGHMWYAYTLLKAGDRNQAISVARQAAQLPNAPDNNGDWDLACFWADAGDTDEALRWLRSYIAATPPLDVPILNQDPDLASLRENPEFKAIVAELKKAGSKQE